MVRSIGEPVQGKRRIAVIETNHVVRDQLRRRSAADPTVSGRHLGTVRRSTRVLSGGNAIAATAVDVGAIEERSTKKLGSVLWRR